MEGAAEDCERLRGRLERVSPLWDINNQRQRLDELSQRQAVAWQHRLQYLWVEHKGWQQRLAALNPYAVLQRGYAIVSNTDGQTIHSRKQVAERADLAIQVSDGKFKVRVTDTRPGEE